jgi:adenosylmethionine-8-amino-7-oxononanoate aminotransferase
VFSRAKEMAPYFQKELFTLQDIDVVENIRGYGMMGGIDMKMNVKPGKAGFECFKSCYEAGSIQVILPISIILLIVRSVLHQIHLIRYLLLT